MDLKKSLFELTPLGKADLELREYLEDQLDEQKLEEYENSLNRYRTLKILQSLFKLLLYASIITALAATIGFDQIKIIQKIASYIGTTTILITYGIAKYFTLIARESYHVRREILLSEKS